VWLGKFTALDPGSSPRHRFIIPKKSPVEAHVHKTSYEPLIDMALYVMVLMGANPLLGQGGGVGPWKSQLF
jgi:hypothetical protein